MQAILHIRQTLDHLHTNFIIDTNYNTLIFVSGMFPYVCLATMPLFCSNNWPKKIINKFQVNILKQKTLYYTKSHASLSCIYDPRAVKQRCNGMTELSLPTKTTWKHKLTVSLLITHCGLQVFLPYSHFITKVSIYF